jgi:hypothetical protein
MYFLLSRGHGEFEDPIAMEATTPQSAVALVGTARELVAALRRMTPDEQNNVVSMQVTDVPCTPLERCELIAAWERRASASSVAWDLRQARKEIVRNGPEDDQFLDALRDIPGGGSTT